MRDIQEIRNYFEELFEEDADAPPEKRRKSLLPLKNKKWAVFNNAYAAVPETVDLLPPGYYKAIQGGIEKVSVNAEQILALPSPEYTAVLKEIEKFWASEEKYRKYGVAYKRGLLLYGPPGTGKTTLVRLLLNNIEKEGGIALEMGDPAAFLATLSSVRSIQPKTPLIAVMEDLEVWFPSSASRVGSVLLSILDGIEGLDKVLFLATTNHPELLEDRVTNRPSRFDRRIQIGYPGAEARKAYLDFLFKSEPYDTDLWVSMTKDLGIAHIKEVFISVNVLDYPLEAAVEIMLKLKDKFNNEVARGGGVGFISGGSGR